MQNRLSILFFFLLATSAFADDGLYSEETDQNSLAPEEVFFLDIPSQLPVVKTSQDIAQTEDPKIAWGIRRHTRSNSVGTAPTNISEEPRKASNKRERCKKGEHFLFGEFLYWQAREDGLEYAERVHNQTQPSTAHRKLKNLHFHWNPGFRVGIGYTFNKHDEWDFSLVYTRIENRAHGSDSISGSISDNSLSTLWYPAVLGGSAREASAHWDLLYNIVDIGLGRTYSVTKRLSLRPYTGARGAFIFQHYKAKYLSEFTFLASESETTLTGNTRFKGDNDFLAGGICAGSDALWRFSPHWGLLGKISGAIYYGRLYVKQRFNGLTATNSNAAPALSTQLTTAKDTDMRTRCNVEAMLGLQWESDLNKGKNHISLALGYELVHWFALNEMSEITEVSTQTDLGDSITNQAQYITNNPKGGSLGLQGAKFRLRYDF